LNLSFFGSSIFQHKLCYAGTFNQKKKPQLARQSLDFIPGKSSGLKKYIKRNKKNVTTLMLRKDGVPVDTCTSTFYLNKLATVLIKKMIP